jgi:hypothetical protein
MYLTNLLCVTSDYYSLVMASLFAERRVPKVTIDRFRVNINFIGGHCVLYRIYARPDPIKASGRGDKNRTPNPAPDGAHVTPSARFRNSGVKALSEVRRPEVHTRTISQIFCVNARSLFVAPPAHQHSQFGPMSAQALPWFRSISWECTWRTCWDKTMLERLLGAMGCLSFLLVTATPLHALEQEERPVPPLPITPRQATAPDHARALSEMADTAARDSAKCQSSGAALGSQAYKECRALLEDKMSIENDVPPDRSYARTRGRN